MSQVPIESPESRAGHYSRERWETCTGEDPKLWRQNLIRPDMISAMLYASGHFITYSGEAMTLEKAFTVIRSTEGKRRRARVLDIGCGRGEMEALMLSLGCSFTAVDFSADAVAVTEETIQTWSNNSNGRPVAREILQINAAEIGQLSNTFRTVLLSESLEHLVPDEFDLAFAAIRKWKALLIVTNWLEFHPIERDDTGWCHVRRVDDDLYDWIASHGKTRLRHGSHLVVQL